MANRRSCSTLPPMTRRTTAGLTTPRRRGAVWAGVVVGVALAVAVGIVVHGRGGPGGGTAARPAGIHLIRHVVVVMQENRSFDSYFGTYPGADGIPMRHGRPSVCMPDPGPRRMPAPVPRRRPGPGRRAPRSRTPAEISTAVGWTASSPAPSAPARLCRGGLDTGVRAQRTRRHGLPRRARDPELLDLRAPLRAPGPHVRAARVLEPARSPVPRLGMVGPVPAIRSSGHLRQRSRASSALVRNRVDPTTPGPTSPGSCTATR